MSSWSLSCTGGLVNGFEMILRNVPAGSYTEMRYSSETPYRSCPVGVTSHAGSGAKKRISGRSDPMLKLPPDSKE